MAKQIKKYGKITLVLGLVIMLTGIYSLIPPAIAADVTSRGDTLSDSRPSTAANHTIQFTTVSAVDLGDTITITFASAFDTASIVEDDVDVKDDTVDLTTAADCTGAEQASVAMASDVLTITICAGDGGNMAAGSVVEIQIGSNATASGTGSNQITNSTAAVYDVTIGGTFGDTGTMKVAVISGVTVSATVAETLTVSVNAITSGTCTTTGGTKIDSTATTIPFSTVTADTFYDICQRLDISTNASNGYSATIQETDQLTSGSDQIADGTCTSTSCTDSTAGGWAVAGDNGFGYCMDDVTGTDANTADSAWGTNGCGAGTQYFKTIADAGASETAQAIMSNTGSVSANQAYVGFRLSVDGAQAAGSYSNSIIYIVTPTY